MRATIEKLLTNSEQLLREENEKMYAMLAEYGTSKTQPAKDYWHKRYKLEQRVKFIKLLLETFHD